MLSVLISWIRMQIRTERGQDLIEYALLGGLIAMAIMVSVLFLQDAIAALAGGISDCVDYDNLTPCAPF